MSQAFEYLLTLVPDHIHNWSFPITVRTPAGLETYQRCLKCGSKAEFDPVEWRRA